MVWKNLNFLLQVCLFSRAGQGGIWLISKDTSQTLFNLSRLSNYIQPGLVNGLLRTRLETAPFDH